MILKKVQLLQSPMQGSMRAIPKVLMMKAARGGRKHVGRGLRSGKVAAPTGIVHKDYHTEAFGKPRVSGRIGGAAVATVIALVPIPGKTGTAKARLIFLAAHGRNGTESLIGDWSHLMQQNIACRKVWQSNSVQAAGHLFF